MDRSEAIASLRRCCHDAGLLASGRPHGHRQIWSRDSMICALGAAVIQDEGIREAIRRSLRTLSVAQMPLGAIPNNVDPRDGSSNFRAYADGGLWYVIAGLLWDHDRACIDRALAWYQHQDVDQSGLLSVQESSDWQDLFCTRGKSLYVNCLHVLALRLAGQHGKAHEAAAAINRWFWYNGDADLFRHVSHSFSTSSMDGDSLGRKRWIPHKRILSGEKYYLSYLSFRDVGEWFDSFGNLLAILAGVADETRTRLILDFFWRHRLDEFPVQSIFPAVCPGDPDWRDYYGELNRPGCYHNGGVWPFLGGFYVATLVKAGEHARAAEALRRLGEMNRVGEFNEWHDRGTGEPRGVRDQAWSAAMYLYAQACVDSRRLLLLDASPSRPVALPGADPGNGR